MVKGPFASGAAFPYAWGMGANTATGKRRATAVGALVLATLFWGSSFVMVKRCGEVLHDAARGTSAPFGPLVLTAVRFTIALPILLLVWPEARRWRPRRRDLRPLLLVALTMAAGFLTQAAGLAWTTATLSGFLTSLTVCFTPAGEWVFHGRRVGWRLFASVALALGGVALMTLTRGGNYSFGWGEGLTLLCAAAFGLQVLWTNDAAERVGPAGLTVGSFAIVAVIAWITVLAAWGTRVPAAIAGAALSGEFWWMFAVVLFFSTMGAMFLMNSFQQYIRPTEAAVIYTTEPVFAGLFAYLYRGPAEWLGVWGLAGAAVVIVADLLAGLKFGEEPSPPFPADHPAKPDVRDV